MERKNAVRRESATFYSKFSRIQTERYGVLVTRLMMAANDISLANWSIERFKGDLPRMELHMRAGAIQYFVRLMCGHLNEAIRLIDAIQKERDLLNLIERCSPEIRRAYQGLCDCLPKGKDHDYFGASVARMRNTIAFHYDPEQVRKALVHVANEPSQPLAKITLGTDFYLFRFNLADVLMDSIVVRQIMRIPVGGDIRAEAKRFESFVNGKCIDFLTFVNVFATTYVRRYASS
jgi:hypothetical protein